jgi:hypothetical protein
MANHTLMRLGKRSPKYDPRVPMFARFASSVALPPPSIDWARGLSKFGVMRNDVLGDCTAAGIAHAFQIWTGDVRREWTPTDEQVVAFYSATTGYRPGLPSTDRGGVEADVLAYLLKHGFYGHHIGAYCSVDVKSLVHVQQAVSLLGPLYIGVALPVSAQTQDVWDVPATGVAGAGAPGSWGGHCVVIAGYDTHGLTCITWGALKKMTWAFWRAYVDEAHAILAGAWIGSNGAAPSGFDYNGLYAAMNEIRSA